MERPPASRPLSPVSQVLPPDSPFDERSRLRDAAHGGFRPDSVLGRTNSAVPARMTSRAAARTGMTGSPAGARS